VGSNPTQGVDVSVVLCVGSGLATGWSLIQGVLLNVFRIKKLKKAAKVEQKDLVDNELQRM
jgi:hypothetical protein